METYTLPQMHTLQYPGAPYKINERINFQNIQAAHTTQCQENKQPNQKVGKRPKQTFLQRHTDD